MPATSFEWAIAVILPLLVSWLAVIKTGSGTYFGHFIVYMILDSTWGHLFHLLLLIPARWIAARSPGSKLPPLNDEDKLVEQEAQSNDPSIIWPSPAVLAKLPREWVVNKSNTSETHSFAICDSDNADSSKAPHSRKTQKKLLRRDRHKTPSTVVSSQQQLLVQSNNANQSDQYKQPYYLNHVRGSTRVRQASQRMSAAAGTLFSSYLVCSYSSLVTLEDIGLGIRSVERVLSDLTIGFLIGSFIVIVMFMLELRMGWIRIVGFRDTVVPAELFAINFSWDVLFHVGVSINEEVMLRGWMFITGCHGMLMTGIKWFDDPSSAANFAIAASIALQAALFSLLHLYSPGCSAVSLLNLFLGGIAASLNVMVTGGSLWLGIGWHFGWNIFMGHILGRSTSGIPMSCALISVIPRPVSSAKISHEKFHGGTFGPEQGVLAPLAYLLGMVLVCRTHSWEELRAWREQLVSDMLNSER